MVTDEENIERDDDAELEILSFFSSLSSPPPVMAVTGIITKKDLGTTEEG